MFHCLSEFWMFSTNSTMNTMNYWLVLPTTDQSWESITRMAATELLKMRSKEVLLWTKKDLKGHLQWPMHFQIPLTLLRIQLIIATMDWMEMDSIPMKVHNLRNHQAALSLIIVNQTMNTSLLVIFQEILWNNNQAMIFTNISAVVTANRKKWSCHTSKTRNGLQITLINNWSLKRRKVLQAKMTLSPMHIIVSIRMHIIKMARVCIMTSNYKKTSRSKRPKNNILRCKQN